MSSTKMIDARKARAHEELLAMFHEAYIGESKRDDEIPRETAVALAEIRDRASELLSALDDDYGKTVASPVGIGESEEPASS